MLVQKRARGLGRKRASEVPQSVTASDGPEVGRVPVVFGWLPPEEFEHSRSLWPENVDYRAYCRGLESYLRAFAAKFASCSLIPVQLDAYRSWCATHEADPADQSNFSTYSAMLDRTPELVHWPPEPQAACWCRSGRLYAHCCGAVTDEQVGASNAAADELRALRQQVDDAEEEFRRTGQLDALAAQLLALRRITSHPAFALAPPAFRRTARGKLVLALLHRFGVLQRTDDLRESVEAMQAAIDDLPDGSAHRADDLSGLAALLSTLHEHTGDAAALTRLIEVLIRAIAETPQETPAHQQLVLSLARAHRLRYEQDGDPADFDRAMKLLGEPAE